MATTAPDKSKDKASTKPAPQKIQIEAKALAKAMKNAAAILSGTAIVPIAGNVRLIASGTDLELTTCDLEIELRQHLTMPAKGELATTVDAKRLLAVANAAPSESVLNISLGDGRVTITAGRGRWVLPVLPADSFPTLPVESLGPVMEVHGGLIGNALHRVEWAIYDGKAQMNLMGVYFHADANGKASCVATNANAMAIAGIDVQFPADAVNTMIPDKLAGTLRDIATDHADTIRLAWDDRKLRAEIGDTVLVGKLMEVSFPEYQRIIPPLDNKPIVVTPENMAEGLKSVMVISDEKTRCVVIDRGDGKIKLISNAGGSGNAEAEVPADCEAGFASGINGQFLSQLIGAIGGDSIEMHQADPKAPFLFRRVVDDGAFAIVMPMKI